MKEEVKKEEESREQKIQWGSHIEFAVLFITLIGGFYMIDAKFERCHERTDKLYEMFYDVVRENRK
jgi:hypothetical protein